MSDYLIDVGIDVGMRRLAYGWPAYGLAGSIDLGRKSGISRDVELRTMREWLRKYLPVGVQLWVDQPFAGNGGIAAAQALSETIGMVLTAQDWTHPPVIVHQATWKSQVLQNHQAGKDEMRAWLFERYPTLYRADMTEDEVDATIIGLYGIGRSEGRILPPEPKKPKRRKTRT